MDYAQDDAPPPEPDITAYLQKLIATAPLKRSIVPAAIRALKLPVGSRGLDVGCGIGTQAMVLAESVGPDGHVTGVDLAPEFLTHAGDAALKSGLSNRTSFHEGDMNCLPFEGDTFDWAWSMDCVGYHPADPLPPLKEMARVVKPGGSVAILAWSSEMLLPGYPLLEARLRATTSGIAPFNSDRRPEAHFLRALSWFCKVGLEAPTAHTFVAGFQAPLNDDLKEAMILLLKMRWNGAKSEMGQRDWEEYQRLCQPGSPDLILELPGYYAFFTYSMFCARVPGKS